MKKGGRGEGQGEPLKKREKRGGLKRKGKDRKQKKQDEKTRWEREKTRGRGEEQRKGNRMKGGRELY